MARRRVSSRARSREERIEEAVEILSNLTHGQGHPTSARAAGNFPEEEIMARTSASAKPLTDHNEIRRWAEERAAKPACVRRTGRDDDIGMIRLDFPGYSGEESLEEVSWDEWFDKFDENNLALLVQDTTARGQQSNFNKLVSRQTASGRARSTSGGRTRAKPGGRSRAKSASTRPRETARSRSAGRSRKTSAVSSRRTRATPKKSVTGARKSASSRSGTHHRRAA